MLHLLHIASTHLKALFTAALLLADGLFFVLSDPTRLPIALMIFGWLLIGSSVYMICQYAYKLLRRSGLINGDRRLRVVTISALIYLVLILQAVGQLSLRDIAALVPLVIIGYLYFRRAKVQKATV